MMEGMNSDEGGLTGGMMGMNGNIEDEDDILLGCNEDQPGHSPSFKNI